VNFKKNRSEDQTRKYIGKTARFASVGYNSCCPSLPDERDAMKNIISLAIISLLAAGCAGWGGAALTPGEPETAVRAALGAPTSTYRDGADTLLEYARGPSGQYTYMARLDPQGRLVSYEQVLTSARFAAVRIGKDNRDAILHSFGRPAEVLRFARSPSDVWMYRYKEQDVWNSVMYVEFAADGMVGKMTNGPDPERESRRNR
jgi:hypothetical protein